jgi:hypothetical protein
LRKQISIKIFERRNFKMAQKLFTEESLETFVDEIKAYADSASTNAANTRAEKEHTHANYASTVTTSGNGNAITAISQNGNTITATKGSSFLTSHPTISKSTDTTSTGKPGHGETFTTVDSVTRDSNGHVTKINTKTITLPSETTLSKVEDVEGIATTLTHGGTFKALTDVSVDGHKITDIVTEFTMPDQYTHPTYTARTGKPTANQTPAFGGTVTVSQIKSNGTGHVTAATDRTITIPSTLSNGTGTAGLIKTSSTVTNNSGYTACPVIDGVPYYKDTDTNTHYASKNVVGATTATSNTTTALSNGAVYLNSVENGAVTSSHKISGSGATTVTTDTSGNIVISSTDNNTTYTSLKNPHALTIQGNGTTLTNGTYDGSAAKTVNITPSSIGAAASSHGTHVTYSSTAPKSAGTASAGSASNVSRGDHVHPAQTSVSGNAGTATKLETARTISLEGDVTGSVTFDGSTNVTMATSLNDSGVTAGSYGQSSNSSPGHSGTFSVPYITVDEKGLITSASTKTITLPTDNNTDTKVTNTLATTTKAYVTGTTSATTNTGTQVFDTGIYLDATSGRLCVDSIVIGGKVLLTYNAEDACLDVSFL